jgi:hypothetical protein
MDSGSEAGKKIIILATRLMKVSEDVERLKKEVLNHDDRIRKCHNKLVERKQNIQKMAERKMINEEQSDALMAQRNELSEALTSVLKRSVMWLLTNRAALDRVADYEKSHDPWKAHKKWKQGKMSDEEFLRLLQKTEAEWEPLCNNFLITRSGLVALAQEVKEIMTKMNSNIN